MSYTATVSRENGQWLAEVLALAGVRARSASLTRLREQLTDAIILADGLHDDTAVNIAFTLASDQEPPAVEIFTPR